MNRPNCFRRTIHFQNVYPTTKELQCLNLISQKGCKGSSIKNVCKEGFRSKANTADKGVKDLADIHKLPIVPLYYSSVFCARYLWMMLNLRATKEGGTHPPMVFSMSHFLHLE